MIFSKKKHSKSVSTLSRRGFWARRPFRFVFVRQVRWSLHVFYYFSDRRQFRQILRATVSFVLEVETRLRKNAGKRELNVSNTRQKLFCRTLSVLGSRHLRRHECYELFDRASCFQTSGIISIFVVSRHPTDYSVSCRSTYETLWFSNARGRSETPLRQLFAVALRSRDSCSSPCSLKRR